MLKEIIGSQHKSTSRDYFERMNQEKPKIMDVATNYSKEYWDGDRKFGYGGYSYDGRWKPVAEKIILEYGLNEQSSVLDLGCGKAFLLHEIKKLIPEISVEGIDISQYAIDSTLDEIKPFISVGDLNSPELLSKFTETQFDLCLSIMTLHNLDLPNLENTLKEISRISKDCFIAVESYRNWEELTNLQCWALTCKSFFTPNEWEYLFKKNDLKTDFEFLYFN